MTNTQRRVVIIPQPFDQTSYLVNDTGQFPETIDGFIIAYYTERLPRMFVSHFPEQEDDGLRVKTAMKWVKMQLNRHRMAYFAD